MRQGTEQRLGLNGFEPDLHHGPALAFQVKVDEQQTEIPLHHHRKGQLILALHGGISCHVSRGVWMIPPQYAVWIPGGMPHSNQATPNARLCFLFIEPGVVAMPEQCCSLAISGLVRELILTLAAREGQPVTAERQRLEAVLFDELPRLPAGHLQLPVSDHPKIRAMVAFMVAHPAIRRTQSAWARELAMSERSLLRLVEKETGLNFRRWRQQLQMILAIRMLIAGQNVQQVSHALGYSSTTAFITLFRQQVGQTPGAWLAELASHA
ncbi:helix-turn-helix transcriptional regulator [Shimwellia pseudoproteus]|uniref:AraC family transcriptional regulator n=1 Tax=Shimwellia pseudoproteus TaxID=570012 RepID=UPI0018ED2848|nr:helix-turn-helix transcriptional regulator [Shimwellia pseudoproteus]MBJ3813932.1 helix-turn-helix transcriptional regulator [Shimwellia pseudoproteus]